MRDSLTVLAILLIALLTAALVAPYLVDWNAHRAWIESRLSDATGTRIAIAGPIRIRLLPQPTFRLGQVTIGAPSPGQPSLTAAELDIDVALTALMRGDLQVGETVLRAPRLDLALAPDGSFTLRLPGFGDPKRVQFQHVVVADGTLTLAQPGRPPLTLAGLDFYGEAASLLGPFKVNGTVGPAADPRRFRLSTGAFEAGKIRVKLGLDRTQTLAALDFDGEAVAAGGPAGPSLSGLLSLKGEVALDGNPATIPWQMSGHIQADRDKASAVDLEWRAGTEMRAASATGTGEIVLSGVPRATLRLHGPRLDLDRLAVPRDGSSVAPPSGADLLVGLSRRWGRGTGSVLPFALDVDYGFDTLSLGSLTVLGVAGQLGLDGDKAARVSLSAKGPDTASLALNGGFEGGVAPVFRGRLTASVPDLPRFAAWLAPAWPDVSTLARRALPVRALAFDGDVDLSGVGVAARDAVLRFDRSRLAGTLTYTAAVGDDRARLFADLTSEAIEIDDLPDLGTSAGDLNGLDLDLTLGARAMTMVPAGFGPVDAGHIDLRLRKQADTARLDRFTAELGRATLAATGTLDSHAATLDAHVDAPDLDALSGLLARLFPGAPLAMLDRRAPVLSPARLDLGLRALRAGDGSLLPTGLTLDGTLAGSHIKAALRPDAPGEIDPAISLFTIELDADAPQGTTLLRQIGLPTALPSSAAASPPLGVGRLKGRAHGSAAEGFVASIDASVDGTVLSFQGRTRSDQGNGHLTLKGNDVAPLLRSAGLAPGPDPWRAEAEADVNWHEGALAFRRLKGTLGTALFSGDLDATLLEPAPTQADKPMLFGTLAVDRLSAPRLLDVILGPAPHDPGGAWSNEAFGSPLLSWPRAALAMKVKSVDLGGGIEARDASLTLRATRGAVTLGDFTGRLGAGNLGGALTLRRDGDAAALNGVASWSGIALDWPGLAGRIGGTMEFGGSGASPAALVSSLAGTGSVTIADGRIARLDPAALTRAALASERNSSGVDADEIGALVGPELDRAPLRLGDVAGQATVAAGVFRVGPLRAVGDAWTAETGGALDLKDFGFSSKTVLRVRQPLPDWKGEAPQLTLLLDGPVAAPRREIDAAAFVNALQSRAIARDQERIDNLQQDIHERAFFNRRLKAIEAEQAAARQKAKAETDASAEVLRQMSPTPLPPTRPAPAASKAPMTLPGAVRPLRPSKLLPGAASELLVRPGVLDPSGAGRY